MGSKKSLTVTIILSLGIVAVIAITTFFTLKYDLLSMFDRKPPAADTTPVNVDVPDPEPLPLTPMTGVSNSAWLLPEVDFPVTGTADEIKSMINSRLDAIVGFHFTDVIIPITYYGDALYKTGLSRQANAELDIVEYAISAAKTRNLHVILTYDATTKDLQGFYDLSDPEQFNTVRDKICEAVKRFPEKAILLENFYIKNETLTGEELSIKTTEVLKDLKYQIRKANGTIYTGVSVLPVWENSSGSALGSETTSENTDNKKGADTYSWAKDNAVDFVLVKTSGSTKDAKEPFEKVTSWWSGVVKDSNTALIIHHGSNNIGKKELVGWDEYDQLSKQILFLKELPGVNGSTFHSVSSLSNDKTGSVEMMLKCFAPDTSALKFTDLALEKPSALTTSTNESKTIFYGISDTNFKLVLNGKEIERDQNGVFEQAYDLVPGVNSFKLEHKGKTLEYKVTYKVVILKSVSPTDKMELDGGSDISFGVTALKGSAVTAVINKKTVKLTETKNLSKDDPSEDYGDFYLYTGSYKLPASAKAEKNLGQISFAAKKNGLSESKKGATVVVKALPPEVVDIVKPEGTVDIPDTVVGDIPVDMEKSFTSTLTKESVTGELITVNRYKAETFNSEYNSDTINYSRPTNSYLPKGAQDVSIGEATGVQEGKTFIYKKLNYGKMVYKTDVTVGNRTTLFLKNELAFFSATVKTRTTEIVLNSLRKAPLSVNLPVNYVNPGARDSLLTGNALNSAYVDVTFPYCAQFTGLPDFGDSHPLFSKAEIIPGIDKTIMRLHLRKAGRFQGWNAEYNDKGQLVLTFLHPLKIVDNAKPLTGGLIVLDPGHGGNPNQNTDSNATTTGTANQSLGVTEKELNRTLSIKIKSRLEALGCVVVSTRSLEKDQQVNYDPRLLICYDKKPDMFISIHHNGGATTATGFENYWFTPFSYSAAQSVYDSVSKLFSVKRGNKWGPYYANRVSMCPSMLIEYGFMSNYSECAWIMKPETQDKFAQATVEGIVNYFKSIQG